MVRTIFIVIINKYILEFIIMKKYLKILACLYFLGGVLHLLDIFDLRLKLSEMATYWKIWIYYLVVIDLITSFGLWTQKQWGIYCFLFVALSQLVAYVVFKNYFGSQPSLIVFHLVTVLIYGVLYGKNLKVDLKLGQ